MDATAYLYDGLIEVCFFEATGGIEATQEIPHYGNPEDALDSEGYEMIGEWSTIAGETSVLVRTVD